MPASSTVSKPSSLPSLASSNTTPSHNSQNVFTPPSNTRAVITAPPWAQDEPPSPTEQPDETDRDKDRDGRKSTINTRPSDLASTSVYSFEGHPARPENRSRWWTFVRPRGNLDWQAPDQQPFAEDQQSHFLVMLGERRSDESPIPRSTITLPDPFGPSRGKTMEQHWNRRGRGESQDESREPYVSTSDRQDGESGEKLALTRSRKNRFRTFILSNIYVPLLFRFINITFTTAALAVAIRIREWEEDYNIMGAVGSSPTLVIIFAPLTLVHVMIAIYVEYFSRPLGLWQTSGKLAHTLLEVCFICAWSAALSLCFDNYFTSSIPCAPHSSTDWYSAIPRPLLNSPGLNQIADTICDSQLALICLVMVGLIMYCTNLIISLFRIFEKVKYHAGTRRRVIL